MLPHNTPKPAIHEFQIEHIEHKYYHRFQELAGSIDFVGAQTLREQIGVTCQKLRDPACENKVPYREIGAFFGLSPGCIERHENAYIKGTKKNGRPSLLSEDEIQQLGNWLKTCYAEGNPRTYADAVCFCSENFNKNILIDTMRNIITKHFFYRDSQNNQQDEP